MVLPDGRQFIENTVTISVEQADRMWAGYMCARCLEPTTEAYPEVCPLCGFPMKELQRKQLEQDFLGVDPTRVGSFPLDREMEHLDRVAHTPKEI
jgi:ribosomal protein L37E